MDDDGNKSFCCCFSCSFVWSFLFEKREQLSQKGYNLNTAERKILESFCNSSPDGRTHVD